MESVKSYAQKGWISFSGFTITTQLNNKGEEKKHYEHLAPWKSITKENYLKYNKGFNIAILTGAISNLTVIDFDDKAVYAHVINEYPELKAFKTVETNKGFHIYGQYNKDLHTDTDVFEGIYDKVDIRNDKAMIVAPPTQYNLLNGTVVEYKDLGGEVLPFPESLIQKQKYIQKELKQKEKEAQREAQKREKEDKIRLKVQRKIDNEPLTSLDDILVKIINIGLLDDKCDSYKDWIEVGFAIFNSTNQFEHFDLFSQRSSKYDAEGVKTFWESIKPKLECGLTFASIIFWAKNKDVDLYKTLNISENDVREKDNEITFKAKSKIFEETHCKIVNEGLYIHEENNDIKVISETEVRNRYKHYRCGFTKMGNPINFIERWLVNNNDIRSKQKMGFYMKSCPDDAYNLWSPFTMELVKEYTPKPEAVELFKKHVSILCNHEQPIIDFVIKWIGAMIQYPELKAKMLVFVSDEGAGKNTLLEIIKKMIGDKKVFESTDPSRDVWGNFNGQMVDAFLVNLNEISALDFKNATGKVKGLITDPTILINEKQTKPFKIQSYHHFITSTNSIEGIKPSKNDRRNCLIRCSDELIKMNKSAEQLAVINAYLKEIYAMIADQDSIKTIFEYLKSIPNLSDFFSEPFPVTDFHKSMTELTVTPIELWLRDFVVNQEEKRVVLSNTDSYTCFKSWRDSYMPHYECNLLQFAVRLSNFNKEFITTKHTKAGNERTFCIPELHKLLFPDAEIYKTDAK